MNQLGKRHHRTGTLVVCVMVCLLVASTMVATTTQSALRSRRDVRLRQQLRQTELLLDAGVHRASRQLKIDADYRGEEWLPKPIMGLTPMVQIQILNQSEPTREIHVIATLGTRDGAGNYREATKTQRSHRFQFTTSRSRSFKDPSNRSPKTE